MTDPAQLPLFTRAIAREIWLGIGQHELGLALPCDPAHRKTLQTRLYEARAALNQPQLHEDFAIVFPGDRDEVWIVRRQKEGLE